VSRERPTQPPRECGSPDSSRCLPRARLVLFVRASRPARGSPLPLLYNHLDNNITGSLSPPDGTHRRSNDHRSASEPTHITFIIAAGSGRAIARSLDALSQLAPMPQKWELSAKDIGSRQNCNRLSSHSHSACMPRVWIRTCDAF
jgi:hypothetical protein